MDRSIGVSAFLYCIKKSRLLKGETPRLYLIPFRPYSSKQFLPDSIVNPVRARSRSRSVNIQLICFVAWRLWKAKPQRAASPCLWPLNLWKQWYPDTIASPTQAWLHCRVDNRYSWKVWISKRRAQSVACPYVWSLKPSQSQTQPNISTKAQSSHDQHTQHLTPPP